MFDNFPAQASTIARASDLLFIGLLAVSAVVLALVFGLMLTFAIRYRKGSNADRSDRIKKSWHWEVSWTAATMVGFLAIFFWGAELYSKIYTPPSNPLKIYVVGKQWMWKVEHPGGQRELDELHVPVNRPIMLVMSSEDVIHSFYVPAFRLKHDVVPGRYESLWFQADRVGTFHLFCSEFCGTNHSAMIGRVVVMEQPAFEQWLAAQPMGQSLAEAGAKLFHRLGCSGCHGGNGTVRAPPLEGVYGSPVPLSDGTVIVADDRYIHDSILLPKSQVAAGYAPVMPSFAGQVSEDDILKLVAYIRSLGDNKEIGQ
jgi:cytochrome c oxidase subunit 2